MATRHSVHVTARFTEEFDSGLSATTGQRRLEEKCNPFVQRYGLDAAIAGGDERVCRGGT
jgi:hypothetical protein